MALDDISDAATTDDAAAEARRIAILDAHETASLTDDPRLTAITDLAAAICAAPVALVTMIGADEQAFLARTGTELSGTTRAVSFCTHAIRTPELMVVGDATADPRFADNPLVTGEPHIRFYAGVPLITGGAALGSLCVIDFAPRDGVTPLQRQALVTLAQGVTTLLAARGAELRQAETSAGLRDERDDQAQRFQVLADAMPQMVWSTRADGYHDYYNARWYEFTGMAAGTTDGEEWSGVFHPDDRARAWEMWRHSLETGDPYEIEYRLRDRHGDYRWVLGRALPMYDDRGRITRWFGTCTDIHDAKLASDQREIIAHELSHRIKNIFSVIGGLIGFSAKAQPEFRDTANTLRNRIMALGRAHDFVRPHSEASRPDAAPSSLHGMLGELLAAYEGAEGARVTVEGDDPVIDDQSATPLALLFHELATNAVKYGALSSAGGIVAIRIEADAEQVAILWSERGGPPVTPPKNSGFGTRLIELSIERQLGGSVARDWAREGLRIAVRIPRGAMRRSKTA